MPEGLRFHTQLTILGLTYLYEILSFAVDAT